MSVRTVLVEAQGLREAARVDVAEGAAALLGRNPDPSALVIPSDAPATPVSLAAPSVSSNHCLLVGAVDALHVHDLGSKNGTWVMVPSQGVVRVDGGSVRLRLGRPPEATVRPPHPEEARFTEGEEFAETVARCVSAWLRQRSLGGRARVVPRLPSVSEGPLRWPLGPAGMLVVDFDHTVDAEAVAVVHGLAGWVARYDALLRAERDTLASGMVLASPAIRRAHRAVVEHGRSAGGCLVLLGPTGAGKERFARAFHRAAWGADAPFVAINCAALKPELAEAELFGAARGAYTGAVQRRLGAVERADGGTLFLDEIGDLPATVQASLLRFLNGDLEYAPVGELGRTRRVELRVVCATHRPLRELAARGEFRQDLWYRLQDQVVEIPALRHRREDVAAFLAAHPLAECTAREAMAESGWAVVCAHGWEGNFRELESFARRLPRDATVGSLDAAAVRELLTARAGSDPDARRASVGAAVSATAWAELLRDAAERFAAEGHGEAPTRWDDLTLFIERYLKPVAVRGMVAELEQGGRTLATREIAERLGADTKTISKHLGPRGPR